MLSDNHINVNTFNDILYNLHTYEGVNMLAEYSERWDMKSVYRGDTIRQWAITIKNKNSGTTIVPTVVICNMTNRRGGVVYSYTPNILPSGKVEFELISGDITRSWGSGVFDFKVEYTMTDGMTRKYIVGSVEILEDEGCPCKI